jgi:hypothetical protein
MSKVKTCDARCHNAKHEKCNCWCGGRFHGKGNEGALSQFIKDVIDDIEKFPEGVSLSLPDDFGYNIPEDPKHKVKKLVALVKSCAPGPGPAAPDPDQDRSCSKDLSLSFSGH